MNATLVEPIELAQAVSTRSSEATAVIKRDLTLLEHVSVRLEVVLGEAATTVKELFALAAGDTLTLDAELEAPVLLRVDGKTIGRGHLVAVGDHFGVRITEVA